MPYLYETLICSKPCFKKGAHPKPMDISYSSGSVRSTSTKFISLSPQFGIRLRGARRQNHAGAGGLIGFQGFMMGAAGDYWRGITRSGMRQRRVRLVQNIECNGRRRAIFIVLKTRLSPGFSRVAPLRDCRNSGESITDIDLPPREQL